MAQLHLPGAFSEKRRFPLWIVLVALVAVTLACAVPGTAAPAPAPTAEVVEEEITEEPTEEEDSDGGLNSQGQQQQSGGSNEPTAVPTEAATPTPEPGGAINRDNANDIEIIDQYSMSATSLTAVGASPTEPLMVTFGWDKVIRFVDADTRDVVSELTGSADYSFSTVFSPDGSTLASGDRSRVYLWDVNDRDQLSETLLNTTRIYDIAWSPDGSRMAVGGESRNAYILDGNSGAQVDEFRNPAANWIWSAAYSPDGSLLALGDADGRLYILDSESLVEQQMLSTAPASFDLEFSPDGSLLVSCNTDRSIYIFDTATWSLVTELDSVHVDACQDGVFSRDGSVYFSIGDGGQFYAWDTETWGQLALLRFGMLAWRIALSDTGDQIIVALTNGDVGFIGLP
ncbi:MAG: WD40 repeat domain-containing protein [Chloroflexi bacterium]|nr:WD40 repeat domain-containing protein [Chloroflexota bacterium]